MASLAEVAAMPDFASSQEWESTFETRTSMIQALARCWSFLSTHEGPAREHRDFISLRPAHLHALAEACEQSDNLRRTLAFRRLVLEEGRHRVLTERRQLIRGLEETLKELADPHFEKRCADEMRALRALGWVYLADDHRMAGHHDLTREYLNRAHIDLSKNPCHAEIQVTYYETVADFVRGQGDFFAAKGALDMAEKYAEQCSLPGRRASIKVRWGLLWNQFGDLAKATLGFRAALDEIPPGHQPRLRLDALHHLAGAEIRRGRFDRGRAALEEAAELYANHAHQVMRAQHAWLWGVIHVNEKRDDLAEPRLRAALAIFEEHALVVDAAQTLTQLGRLHVRAGHDGKLTETTLRFVTLMNQPAARKLSTQQRRELVEQIRASGINPFGLVAQPTLDDAWIN